MDNTTMMESGERRGPVEPERAAASEGTRVRGGPGGGAGEGGGPRQSPRPERHQESGERRGQIAAPETLLLDRSGAPRWGLCVRGGHLCFSGGADAPPVCLDADRGGGFVEGLWEGDVAELFLLNPATGHYLEFNLSPRGAWWCCAFNAPRVRAEPGPAPLPGARAEAAPSETGWESALVVPLASLPAALAFDPDATRGNVAFCLGRPRRYYSLARLGGGAPDFHRPRGWPPLREILARGQTPG